VLMPAVCGFFIFVAHVRMLRSCNASFS
jgi:hypothetical protein